MQKKVQVKPENPESLSESAREPPDFFMIQGLFAVLESLSAFLLVLIFFSCCVDIIAGRTQSHNNYISV